MKFSCITFTTFPGEGLDVGADPAQLYEFVGYDSERGKHFCLKCPKFSHKSRSNVRNHVEALHFLGMFAYSCQICGQSIGSKNALNTHMSRIHKKV